MSRQKFSPPPFFEGEAIWLASSPMLVGAWLSACHLVLERDQASCGHFLGFMSRWWFDALGLGSHASRSFGSRPRSKHDPMGGSRPKALLGNARVHRINLEASVLNGQLAE